MKKIHSLLGFTTICTALAMATLSSCTVGDGDDDDDGGAGGESAEGGTKPSGGTRAGGTGGTGGSAGNQTSGNGPGGGGAGGDGGAAPGGAGAGGAGAGGTSSKVCEGEGGAVAAEGVSCAEYCSEFFDKCAAFAEDAAFENEAACRTSCGFFLNEQLCCRAFHVILAGEAGAGGGANAECAQAAGTETCN
jgi:hypothetical protein